MDAQYDELEVRLGGETRSLTEVIDAVIAMQALQMDGFKSAISSAKMYDRLVEGSLNQLLKPEMAERAMEEFSEGVEPAMDVIETLTFSERSNRSKKEGRDVSVDEVLDEIRGEVITSFEVRLAEPVIRDTIRNINLQNGITEEEEAPNVLDGEITQYLSGDKSVPQPMAEERGFELRDIDRVIQDHFEHGSRASEIAEKESRETAIF